MATKQALSRADPLRCFSVACYSFVRNRLLVRFDVDEHPPLLLVAKDLRDHDTPLLRTIFNEAILRCPVPLGRLAAKLFLSIVLIRPL